MGININIKVDASNLSLIGVYELLAKYSKENKNNNDFYEFNGFIYKIEKDINMGISYIITEII